MKLFTALKSFNTESLSSSTKVFFVSLLFSGSSSFTTAATDFFVFLLTLYLLSFFVYYS